MLDKLFFHVVYPGFFKLIAPVEIKVALVLILAAAVMDRLKKYWASSVDVYEYNYVRDEDEL